MKEFCSCHGWYFWRKMCLDWKLMVTESQFKDKGYNQDFLAIIIIKKNQTTKWFHCYMSPTLWLLKSILSNYQQPFHLEGLCHRHRLYEKRVPILGAKKKSHKALKYYFKIENFFDLLIMFSCLLLVRCFWIELNKMQLEI